MRALALLLPLALSACPPGKPPWPGDTGAPCVDADSDGYCAYQDCDDADASVHPGAEEDVCNDVDDDCDGTVDEWEEAVEPASWYLDADGDGYGDPHDVVEAPPECPAPSGRVADGSDCDDTNAEIHVGAEEVCDAQDNDCDGAVDEEDAADAPTWYADDDDDHYGDAADAVVSCQVIDGRVGDATDCDDSDPAVNPGVEEDPCNGVDDDCDGTVDEWPEDDEGLTATWYADGDGDGYGDASDSLSYLLECGPPSGYVAGEVDGVAFDCDDTDPAVNPDADEYCDGVDTDCSGVLDDSYALDATTWYADDDGDGYGDATDAVPSCDLASGRVLDDTDCDDTDASVYPGADEYCNGVDDDCNGWVDDEYAVDTIDQYEDRDGDGYGGALAGSWCELASAYVLDHTDCDDLDASIHPGASEDCDGVDQDCDGDVDEDEAYGIAAACAGQSCFEILNEVPSAVDGTYWIDPDGTGAALEVYCDMSTDGGGWTLITNVLSIAYTWTTSGDLADDFAFDDASAARVAAVSGEIRYQCEGSPGDVIDVTTTETTWFERPYSYGDACSLGYNWFPDTSGFTYLADHSYGTMGSPWSVSCCCRTSHLLATYSIGFDYYSWFIDDLYYVGDTNTPRCAGTAPAAYMRVFYR